MTDPSSASLAVSTNAPSVTMGTLELRTYRRCWRYSWHFRRYSAAIATERERKLATEDAAPEPCDAVEMPIAQPGECEGLPIDTEDTEDEQADDDRARDESRRVTKGCPKGAGEIAASLHFSRLFDGPQLAGSLRRGAPVIVIDVADASMLGHLTEVWRDVLFDSTERPVDLAREDLGRLGGTDAFFLAVKEPPKGSSKSSIEEKSLAALAFALPVLAISPLGRTHLPDALNRGATHHIDFPALDSATIVRTIRIVTGKTCRETIPDDLTAHVTLTDLEIAVRFDRTPHQCLSELRRLNEAKISKKNSRDLTLEQLHGLGEARSWAKAAITDIQAWKRGEIAWSAVSSAVALSGPPGCGKTTFAAVFAADAGLHFIGDATLAKWQSAGHLGDLLRAMRKDFAEARAQAPSCLFIDEIDSFPDRSGITHSHRDYVVEVVNALLAEVDGIAGREGVVIIGASNDIGRCDPALLRSGRFDRVVQIGRPDIPELEKMFRVRLGNDLLDEDIMPVAELAVGMTGADVERVVKDARRSARQDSARALILNDLRKALVEEDDRPEELRWRTCVHEAAHVLIDVINFGPEDVFARTVKMQGSFGMSVRTNTAHPEGTVEEYRKRLEVMLAGRTGEQLIFGGASHGSGGTRGSDLQQATAMACAMIGSFGLAGPTPLTYLGTPRDAADFLAFTEVRAAVDRELSGVAQSCASKLKKNRHVLEAIARRLAQHGRIQGVEVAALLAGLGRKSPPAKTVPAPAQTTEVQPEPRYE